MGILTKHITLQGDKGEMETEALFDTGVSYSFVRRDVAERLATMLPLVQARTFETAQQGMTMTATQVVRLEFLLNGYRFSDEFIVLDELFESVIIGAKTMQGWRLKLDMEHEEVIIDPSVTQLRLKRITRVIEEIGDDIIIVEGVPAGVCVRCGEKEFTPDTIRHLERIGKERTGITGERMVPVVEFGKVAAGAV